MARQSKGRTSEARERQLIALAVDQAEKLLEEGRAPTSVLLHYLQLGASDYPLKKERIMHQNNLYRAKAEQIDRQQDFEQIAKDAMDAFQRYSGNFGPEEYYDEML